MLIFFPIVLILLSTLVRTAILLWYYFIIFIIFSVLIPKIILIINCKYASIIRVTLSLLILLPFTRLIITSNISNYPHRKWLCLSIVLWHHTNIFTIFTTCRTLTFRIISLREHRWCASIFDCYTTDLNSFSLTSF